MRSLTTHHALQDCDNQNLHPVFTGLEPTSTDLSHPSFGRRLGVPFQDVDGDWYSQSLATLELPCLYDVPNTLITNTALVFSLDATIDGIIKLAFPLSIRISTFNSSSFLPHISDSLVTKCDAITSVT